MNKLFLIIIGVILLFGLITWEISTPVLSMALNTHSGTAEPNSDKAQFLSAEDNKSTNSAILINEVKYKSTDEGGWVELYNSGISPVNLNSYYLSNDITNLRKWKFPDVSISPGELSLVWTPTKDTDISSKELKADFEISSSDKSLMLTNPDGVTVEDQLSLISAPEGQSLGRYPDGGSNLKLFATPTKNISNNNIILTNAPGKPGIAITWDDDSIDEWHNLLSLQWYKGVKSTFCLTQPYRLNESKWEKLRELKRNGHEIASHGYNHENALIYIKSFGIQAYINNEIQPSINLMTSKGLAPTSFVYPYGAYNSMTNSALLNYFKTVRITSYSRGGDLFKWGTTKVLPANGLDSNYPYTLEDYYSWLEKANNTNQVAILYGHTPTAEGAGDYRTPHQMLELIIKKARELNLAFYTLSDLSTEVGIFKIDYPDKDIGRLEWTLDRKNWHLQGNSGMLPAGEYMLMVRSPEKHDIKPLKIEKGKTTVITLANN